MRHTVLAVVALCAAATASRAQSGFLEGTVTHAATGSPVAGALLGAGAASATTDAAGRFRMALPAGPNTVRASRVGLQTVQRTVTIPASGAVRLDLVLADAAVVMDAVVVSATREARRLDQTAASVGVVSGEALRNARPTHPGEVLGRIPGVWVSVTGGEGHMTAIRQPRTTNPVFLFLEDGIPTRSTGFFNHNALYEVNVPAAERIEVLKGPATALYGSDAIGGVVNVETRAPAGRSGVEAYAEGGAFGWNRVLGSASGRWRNDAVRTDVNLTRTDGWRSGTGYDRQTGSLRWDHLWSAASLKTVATFSRIDQQTAGSSTLTEADYRENPAFNYTPISFRDVRAARVSSAYERTAGASLLSVTVFGRWNEMGILPNWSLGYDPSVYTSGHHSLGLIARYRLDLEPIRTRIIAGVDVDHSPGFRREDRIVPTRSGEAGRVYASYQNAGRIYDYDVTFHGTSPYLQAEVAVSPRLRLSAGMRYDDLGYDYDTRQGSVDTVRYRVLDDTILTYHHLSPKLGATWNVARSLNLFATFNHGFRAPSEGQVFRPGRSLNTAALRPVRADSYEAGARGELFGRLGYTFSAYRMEVSDDILTFQNADNTRETVNAGRTRHEGLELGLGAALGRGLRADLSLSRARHSYRDWIIGNVDYSGNEMEAAPRDLWTAHLAYAPRGDDGPHVGLDYQRIGSYWLDPANTVAYEGHHLVHLTAEAPVSRYFEATIRINNLTGEHYAEGTAFDAASRTGEYAPGMPTSVYAGLQLRVGS